MPISIPNQLVEFILLGPMNDRRQLQDSPILGDVWIAFAAEPDKRHDLLIEPYIGNLAGNVAESIDDSLGQLFESIEESDDETQNLSFLEGYIVANLTFKELILTVAPKTAWWIDKIKHEEIQEVLNYNFDELTNILYEIFKSAEEWNSKETNLKFQKFSPIKRFLTLTGLILWAGKQKFNNKISDAAFLLEKANQERNSIAKDLTFVASRMKEDQTRDPLVWQVSLNRIAIPAISKSVPAVKADAANSLFKVDCSKIGWAVLDSGIDGNHPAFKGKDGKSRIKRSFDFSNIRRIVSFSNRRPSILKKNVRQILSDSGKLKAKINQKETERDLKEIGRSANNQAKVRWELVEKYIEIKIDQPPYTDHGTHVAGIIGASDVGYRLNESIKNTEETNKIIEENHPIGICPDILLYDFRVLGETLKDTEFAIIAALQFIRYLNSQDKFLTIHGANLSLSIPHDVRNFACGRTPICEECMRLVSNGVVVVVAAGNHGYKSFQTNDGSYDSYAAFSITDPGNAESVITVGSTHRFYPHTYGVSFFSSRGPTGDGRMKPDLVAPGERILSTIPGNGWDVSDGTSMAAPHVSGAAAMLMARYEEFINDPQRIKKILCESATDLGRERSFQGHGMLDVLRAFQSV